MGRLKVEETKDVSKAEIQTEREVQRGLSIENNLSQSWEDLSLSETPKESRTGSGHSRSSRVSDPTQPLTIGVGPFPSPRTSPSPSPSPTRSSVPGKQCFSPSMQMPVPNLSFLSRGPGLADGHVHLFLHRDQPLAEGHPALATKASSPSWWLELILSLSQC